MSFESSVKPDHLDPSILGTKTYWDDLYARDIINHSHDPEDEGTIWFEEYAAEDCIADFLTTYIVKHKIVGKHVNRDNCSFLDLGTGNGVLLSYLRYGDTEGISDNEPWNGRMLGVDYSEQSVEFAARLESERTGRKIEFKHWDIMASDPAGVVLAGENADGWDVVLDKGTFDAISLSAETDTQGRRICEGYRDRVLPLLRKNGIFLVTSCNWTLDELTFWFGGPGLKFVDMIRFKNLAFGGGYGQTLASVCFQKC